MKVSYFVIFLKNFLIYSSELRPVKEEIRLNGGRLRGSLLYLEKTETANLMGGDREFANFHTIWQYFYKILNAYYLIFLPDVDL